MDINYNDLLSPEDRSGSAIYRKEWPNKTLNLLKKQLKR